MALAKLN